MSRINKSIIAGSLVVGMQAATVCAEGGATGEPLKRVLWSDSELTVDNSPANQKSRGEWEGTVYPIGNGRLGCTVFGDTCKERIQFNEDSLWVGNEDCTGGYQPFGDVYVETPHANVSDYRRELDISRALSRAEIL